MKTKQSADRCSFELIVPAERNAGAAFQRTMFGFSSPPVRCVLSFGFRMWLWVLVCLLTMAPALAFIVPGTEEPQAGEVVDVLNRIVQVLETRERHTEIYERVALLEETLSKKTETEARLETEMVELRAKIPALEQEIETIPEMKKNLAEFEAKIEKLVHDYEAKLSALASEVIRLKKYGARRKDLLTLSDGTDVLLRREPPCPELGLGMVAERVGEQCLYFYFTSQLNWTSAHRHCQQLGGDLAAPENLEPLKVFLHQDFVHGPSLWLGASYNLDGEEAALDPSAITYANPANSLPEDKRGGLPSIPDTVPTLGLSSNSLEESGDGDSSSEESAAMVSEAPRDTVLDEVHSNMLFEEGSNSIFLGDEAGSIRRILDQAAMFDEDDTADSGNPVIPRNLLKPHLNTLNKLNGREASAGGRLKARVRDAAVVDFILLSDPVEDAVPPAEGPGDQNLPEYSNLEERSVSGNLTAADVLAEDVNGTSAEANGEGTAPGDDAGGREPQDPEGHEARESKDAKKATMKCMLLQQKESRGYVLIGRPCDETHNFVCDMKFTFDNFLRE